ncbi:MAG: hypothetical protein IT372_02025 [Polyangiaceae bacterium]|nr:hypothetical protein [Polyangiaceae bacterium]
MTRAQRTGLAAALAFTACLAAAPAASADEPGPNTLPINIVAVQTPDAYDQAEALTKALRLALKAVPGWSLGEGDFSLEVLTLSLKCGDIPDASCQSKIADQIKTDRYIWGNVQKKGANVTGQVHLWVRGQGTTSAPLDYSANLTEPNDEALRRIAADTLQALTGGPPKGTIHVRVGAGVAGGQVFLDGKPVGALKGGEGTFPSASGPHKVLVKAPGYLDVESTVVVKPNVPADVALTPVPVETEEPVNWKRVGGFVGVGAGVAFGIVGVVGMVQVNGVQNDKVFTDYAAQFDSSVNVCDQAKNPNAQIGPGSPDVADLCDKASTFSLIQAVFFPLAAVSAGLGTYLILTSQGDEGAAAPPKTGWTVQPYVGKESGKLSATYRW